MPEPEKRDAPPPQQPLPRVGNIADVRRVGLPSRPLGDLYHQLLKLSWSQLFVGLLIAYIAANGLFALVYWMQPGSIENARPGSFYDAFFFSVQTMATIGYGKMTPATTLAHVLVTLEALVGLLGFAMATGFLFAKFSRPTARVIFSRVAILTVRDGAPSLMFRMANERANQIVEAQISLSLVRRETTAEGEAIRRIYDLKLARARTPVFVLSFTAVHPIGDDSPLKGATRASLVAAEASLVVTLTGIDDTFAQTVHARHAYAADEIVFGGRFADIMLGVVDGRRTIDYGKFHDVIGAQSEAGASTTTE